MDTVSIAQLTDELTSGPTNGLMEPCSVQRNCKSGCVVHWNIQCFWWLSLGEAWVWVKPFDRDGGWNMAKGDEDEVDDCTHRWLITARAFLRLSAEDADDWMLTKQNHSSSIHEFFSHNFMLESFLSFHRISSCWVFVFFCFSIFIFFFLLVNLKSNAKKIRIWCLTCHRHRSEKVLLTCYFYRRNCFRHFAFTIFMAKKNVYNSFPAAP